MRRQQKVTVGEANIKIQNKNYAAKKAGESQKLGNSSDQAALSAAAQGLELVQQLQSQQRWPNIQAGFVNINIV